MINSSNRRRRLRKCLPFLGVVTLMAALAFAAVAEAGTVTMSVTDREGKPVADAVVVVSPVNRTTPRNPLPATVRIVQEKMQFVPAVTLAPIGASATFVNNDGWDHHVRGSAAGLAQFAANDAGGFELRLEGRVEGKAPRQADVQLLQVGAVLLGCHLHSSMRGHIYVTDSPWSAKTGADGKVSFDDVPDGAGALRVWHADQLIDLPAQAITVGAKPVEAAAQLQVVPRRRRI